MRIVNTAVNIKTVFKRVFCGIYVAGSAKSKIPTDYRR